MNHVEHARSERITLDCGNKLLMIHQFLRICSMNSTHLIYSVTAEDILHLNTTGRGNVLLSRIYLNTRQSGLERGPLSLVRIIGELLERKSSGSGLENRY
jgi:hypothetical protein